MIFVVLAESPVGSEPTERTLYDPSLRKRIEPALRVLSTGDTEYPVEASPHQASWDVLISAVCEDYL